MIKALANQPIAGLKRDPLNYEAHVSTVSKVNQIINNLNAGEPISPANFSVTNAGSNPSITGTSGTFKRGKFTLTIGTAPSANPSVTLNFPSSLFDEVPFAQISRNGGTGTLGFTYAETKNSLTITLSGTPTAGQTFTFQFLVTS